MCIVIVCQPGCDVINFEINLTFLRQKRLILLVYGRKQPYFSKNKGILENFGCFFLLRFYCYLLFLHKTYNNQNQKGYITCQKKPLEVLCKKRYS